MLSRKQRKQLRWIVSLFFGMVILVIGGWILSRWLTYQKAKSTHYPEFGIAIPDSYSIHGIDVSKYQQVIAWEEVQAMKVNNIQLGFVFIKATEGIDNIDPQFSRNWKKAKANGITCGAYHFFIGSKDGKMQAANFIDQVDLQPGDLPPVLDVEQLNGATVTDLRKEVKKWLDVTEAYYHVKPIIYTNVGFYNRCLGSEFDKYPLWVAHYYQPDQPRINRGWIFWQHSDEGRVDGILSKVDFNVFSGDSSAFKDILIR